MIDYKNLKTKRPINLYEIVEAALGTIGLIASIGAVLYISGLVQAI